MRLATLRLPAPGRAVALTATASNPAARPNRGEALVRTAIRPMSRSPRPGTPPETLTVQVADISIPATQIEAEQDAIAAALVAADALASLPASAPEVGDQGDEGANIAVASRTESRPERRPVFDTTVFALPPEEIVAQAEQPRAETARVVVASAARGSWSVQLGAFRTRDQAERHLIQTALAEMESLNGATRDISSTIVEGRTMFRARFVGMSSDAATRACTRLIALSRECLVITPQI